MRDTRTNRGLAALYIVTAGYGVKFRRSAPLRLPMHPEAPDFGSWRQWVLESEQPVAIDLFSGAGGLSEGLEAAGYRVVLSVDIDAWALETHAHNFPGLALGLDLAELANRDGLVQLLNGIEVDLIAGGPPCQPFSRAGRSKIQSLVDLGARDDNDPRKELWRAFLDLVEKIQPRAVLMENVPDMAFGDDMLVLRHMIHRLEGAGYSTDARVLDSSLYGVPQHRQRLILIGVRDAGILEWPATGEPASVRDAIGDLPKLRVDADTEVGAEILPYWFDGPTSDFALRARKQSNGESAHIVYDHVTRRVRADDLEAFSLMRPGTLYSDLPVRLQRYRADIFDDKYNRLAWDDRSRSITAHIAKDGYWYIHPEQHRTLTVREAARIQTFPDHFRFAGSRSHQFTQIGNAVPPLLAEAVGVGILKAARSEKTGPSFVFRNAFRSSTSDWAVRDRLEAPWRYPESEWTVAVGLILGSKGDAGWPNPKDVLRIAPTFEDANPRVLAALVVMADPGVRRRSVQKLESAASAVRNDPQGWRGEGWLRTLGLGPVDKSWFDLLAASGTGLVASSAALRVSARVTGTDGDRKNRHSAGRIELAKLVGAGADAPMLNAAIHRLGSAICTVDTPLCGQCPVRNVCHGRLS